MTTEDGMLGANIHITGGRNNTKLQPDNFYVRDLTSSNDSLHSMYVMQFFSRDTRTIYNILAIIELPQVHTHTALALANTQRLLHN